MTSMRLLILGYSSIAERRVLPATQRVDAITEISLASRSRAEPAAGWAKRGRFFSDYRVALDESDADLVYISLPNAFHDQWVFAALAAGKHVIVDKPAFMTMDASVRAVAEARRRRLLLAEATVFAHHAHFDALLALTGDIGTLTHVDAQFIIPPLPITNFRNHADLGGGCLLDMGPYAAALARLFGGGTPSRLFAVAGGRHPQTGVDMGFSMLARLANGTSLTGHFSFEGEYQNRLIAVAPFGSVLAERIFSPPANHKIVWQRRMRNVEDVVTFEASDIFKRFLQAVVQSVATGNHEPFHLNLLADAAFRAQLANALSADDFGLKPGRR
jgi:dTDP-3,4-didehydro-2,6-dideoxy-alpha-D-glucose 3-reductase